MRNEGSGASHDLHGWKDIARYMGRSVRAVQRWEAELGLPVHRLKTAAGQTVFANTEELDAWRSRNEIPPDATPPLLPSAADGPPEKLAPGRVRRGTYAALLTLAAGIATALVLRQTAAATPKAAEAAAVSDVRLAGNTLEAVDGGGAVVWRHTFDEPLAPPPAHSPRGLTRQVMRADLDGDGRREIIAAVTLEPAPVRRSDRVVCFREDGTRLWTYDPSAFTLTFRSGAYAGSWHVQDVAFSPPPGRQRIWVALGHHTWWPAAVVELDASGRPDVRFVQSGAVYALAVGRRHGRLTLFAGGVNNEYGSAALAMLDPDTPVSSPQGADSDFRCANCPAATPTEYVVLPRSDVNGAKLPYNRVAAILQNEEGTLAVHTTESFDAGTALIFRFGNDGAVKDVAPTDGFWDEHRKYVASGLLRDREEDCPARGPLPLRVWTNGGGWETALAAAAAIPAPASSPARPPSASPLRRP